METGDRQNIEDGFMLAVAQSSATTMAFFGLCHELAATGALRQDAIRRIENFCLTSILQGDASEDAAQALAAMYRQQFAQIHGMSG